MKRAIVACLLVWCFSKPAQACSCIDLPQACMRFGHDAVFVGRVIELTPLKRPVGDKGSYTLGYQLRFAVDEVLRGALSTEVVVETGWGGGDCGTPLPPGGTFLIFASKNKEGELWTGLCSGNRALNTSAADSRILDEYRRLAKISTGSIFGTVSLSVPVWRDDEVEDGDRKPMSGVHLVAHSDSFSAIAQSDKDGTYRFESLPEGKYTVMPSVNAGLDFDREDDTRYQAEVTPGACSMIDFALRPATRIKGHVTRSPDIEAKGLEVVAIPIHMKKPHQYDGKSDFVDENGRFDLWPLPPGDYYVGVNINSSPKPTSPYLPTYFPGVTEQSAAAIVHLKRGEVRELELPLLEVEVTRPVHFTAIGVDGKPLTTVYVQLEDLRQPGDASSYVNVDLDSNGAGTLMVYQGYSYHLHASHFVKYGEYWCAKPVLVKAGTEPVEARFELDMKRDYCGVSGMDEVK
jgi:hypothetical protein